MTPANEPAGDSMAQPEPVISSYLQREAASVPPDAGTLVLRAVAQGQRVRRRRLAFGGAGVAASVAVAAIAVTGLAAPGWMHRAVEPASTQSLVPSTPRGLAAAVLAHLPGQQPERVRGRVNFMGPQRFPGAIADEADFARSGDHGTTMLAIMAFPQTSMWHRIGNCHRGNVPDPSRCMLSQLPDGSWMLAFDTTQLGGPSFGAKQNVSAGYAVAVNRGDSIVLVTEQLAARRAEAIRMRRSGGYPISVSTLEAIATDPLVGMQTSPQMIAAGAKIANFTHRLAEFTSGSASGSASYSSGGGCAPPPGQSVSTLCSSGSASGSTNSPCSSMTQSGCTAESPTPSLSGSGTASYGSGCNTATGASCRPRDYATPRPSPPAK